MIWRAIVLWLILACSCRAEIMVRSVRADSVRPGERAWIWFPKGLWDADPGKFTWEIPTLPDGWRYFYPLKTQDNQPWGRQWCAGVYVPPTATPGEYDVDLHVTGEPAVKITVVAAPAARQVFRAKPANLQAEIQGMLNAGFDIELLAGVYVWNTWLDLPDNSRVFSGGGAKIVRHWEGDEGTFKRVFHPLGSATIQGLTLSHDESIPAGGYENICYVHAFRADLPPTFCPPGRLTIQDCTVERGSLLNLNQRGCLIERCHFPRSGLGHLPPNSVITDCDFRGRAHIGQHALLNNGSSDSFLGSLVFDGTTRGPIFQNHYATGCILADIDCVNIRGGESYGSNECLLFETPFNSATPPQTSIADNLILDFRVSNSAGIGISLYGDGIRNNKFINCDLFVDGPAIYLASLSPAGILGRNEFSNVETIGWIELHGHQEPQKFDNLAMVKTPARRGNLGPWTIYKSKHDNWPFDRTGLLSDIDYEITGFSKLILPDGYVPLRGIKQFEATTTDDTEKVLYWLPVGWDYAEASGTEAWHCEYTVTAYDVNDKTRTASFFRRCKVTRVDGEPAAIVDDKNGHSFEPSQWMVHNSVELTDRLEIRVRARGNDTVKWKLQTIKWQRIY